MLWGDMRKKSGGHKRYRGKKAEFAEHFASRERVEAWPQSAWPGRRWEKKKER